MKNILSNIVIFSLGAAVGSVVTWKLIKTKYEHIAQEEIDEVREFYHKKMSEQDADKNYSDWAEEHPKKYKEDKENYTSILKENDYTKKKGRVEDMFDKPYVISPDEFGENNYETESLTYYEDGVLTDDFGNVIENVDELVGLDSLNHFGEYEDDSVFVRDDRLKIDYEILMDTRKYSELNDENNEEGNER